MWVGIDFGTTNSAITFSDGKRIHAFRVDEKLPDLLPSLIYITRNYDSYVGTRARDTYLEKNTNRPSLFKPVEVGVIRLDVGDSGGFKQIHQAVIVMVDVLAPGRLLRSIKTGLRTIEYDGSSIFGREYGVDELISILLKQMVDIAAVYLGEPVTQAVIGRPVKFSDDLRVDQRAEERITSAARLAGITEVRFLPEPIAAAYAYHRDFEQPTTTLIFDFGGGTLDLTVAELGGDKPRILATDGVLIGGDDLDRRLFAHLLPYFGKGARLRTKRLDGTIHEHPIPAHIWGALLDWQTMEEMKRTDALKMIEAAAEPDGSTDPQAMQALYDLIYHHLYYKLLQEVERVKIALSSAESVQLSFHERNIHIEETLTRQQFEQIIHQEIWEINRAVDRVVAAAGMKPEEIAFIVNTGGSSLIPAFHQLLTDKFDAALSATRAERNLTGVAQGLGIYGFDLDSDHDAGSTLLRSRLIDAARTDPQRGLLTQSEEGGDFSHAVVGINSQGDVQFVPWRSGQPAQDSRPVWLRSAVFTSRAGSVLLGTTHSRFIVPELDDLDKIMRDPEQTPFYLKLERAKAEEFIFVEKWGSSDPTPLLILVTRWGNVRSFQRRLVEKPLRESHQWQLDMRGQPDPPAAFVGVQSHSQLLLLTESGRATRIPVRNISVRGSKGLKLKAPETIHALCLDGVRQAIIVDADGYGERLVVSDVPVASSNGTFGRHLFRDGMISGVLPVAEAAEARAITSRGRVVTLDLVGVKQFGGRHRLTELQREEQIVRCWI
jgi:hypothetical chaperone protein